LPLFQQVLILAFDHNKDHLLDWAETIIGGDANNYVDGMAFHWYVGNNDRMLDGTYGYEKVNATHAFAPDKILLASEACSCPGVRLGDWLRAERLGHDVLFDLINYAQGWIDWNLLVDADGGPNHLKNFCDASLITLPGTGGAAGRGGRDRGSYFLVHAPSGWKRHLQSSFASTYVTMHVLSLSPTRIHPESNDVGYKPLSIL